MRMLIAAILLFTAANSETTTCIYEDGYAICETSPDGLDIIAAEERAEERKEAQQAAQSHRDNMQIEAELRSYK